MIFAPRPWSNIPFFFLSEPMYNDRGRKTKQVFREPRREEKR